MKQYLLILTLSMFFLARPTFSQVTLEQTTVDTLTITSGLDIPWEILWGPDNHIWITERFGRVSRIDPESGDQDVILDISDKVLQSGESGLLGMALHPDFDLSPSVFLAYTYASGSDVLERIVKYQYDGGILSNEAILLDNIRGSYNHDGCRLIISPDLKLYITTGDALVQQAAQDINDLSGKVLRINLDGSVPDDNPWPGNPVWSFGHRNAQGLYLSPAGILYSSEHGPSNDDEFNVIESGRNYGWPQVHGYCDQSWEQSFCAANDVAEPLTAWTPTVAASDIILYDHPAIPEWQGSILMTTLKNKRIYELELDESGMEVTGQNQFFNDHWGRLRDICMDPDGAIYLATNGPSWTNTHPFSHRIIKVWNPDYLGLGNDELLTKAQTFEVFPNPAKDYINIIPISDEPFEYIVTSLDGKEILRRKDLQNNTMIPVADLKPGLYLIKIATENSVAIEKIIIE